MNTNRSGRKKIINANVGAAGEPWEFWYAQNENFISGAMLRWNVIQ